MKIVEINQSVAVDQDRLQKIKDRMKHDKGYKAGIELVGFPLDYVAALIGEVAEDKNGV